MHTCFTLGSAGHPLLTEGAARLRSRRRRRRRGRGAVRGRRQEYARFARFFLLAAEVAARGGCFYRLADSAGKYICSWRLRTSHAISLSLASSLSFSLRPAARCANSSLSFSLLLAGARRQVENETTRERRRADSSGREREGRDEEGGATKNEPSRRDRGRERARHEGERVREPERLRGERSQLVIRSPPTDERAATERDRD